MKYHMTMAKYLILAKPQKPIDVEILLFWNNLNL